MKKTTRTTKLPERTCPLCGETYRFRREDRHLGSDYCLVQATHRRFTNLGLVQLERSRTNVQLVVDLDIRYKIGPAGKQGVQFVPGQQGPYRGVVKDDRLYADSRFVLAVRMTQGVPYEDRVTCVDMLLSVPGEFEALGSEHWLAGKERHFTASDHRTLIERARAWKKATR